jgi:hypothetical protein
LTILSCEVSSAAVAGSILSTKEIHLRSPVSEDRIHFCGPNIRLNCILNPMETAIPIEKNLRHICTLHATTCRNAEEERATRREADELVLQELKELNNRLVMQRAVGYMFRDMRKRHNVSSAKALLTNLSQITNAFLLLLGQVLHRFPTLQNSKQSLVQC